MNKWWLVGLSLPAVAGLAWIAIVSMTDGKAPARTASTQTSTEVVASSPVLVPQLENAPRKTTTSAPSATHSVNAVDSVFQAEPMPMKALQELLDEDAEAALVVARKDLAREPDGPDAAERTWVVVKALTKTGHFDDARREAEVMVPKFRGSRWADDVERHVLAHPP